jgi:succinate dehydrogenase / fumarate reductase cytochrome b subunit
MSWLKRTLSSSIGGKYIVALTGIAMVGFLVAHLSGNLLVYAGPQAMHDYAEGLRRFPAVLWALRLGLIVAAFLHVTVAIKLNLASQAARPVAYVSKNYRKATMSSRNMLPTGLILLAYIIYHLADFTWRWTNAEVSALGHYDVYQMLLIRLSSPVNAIIYMIAMITMGIHLSHGVTSLFQTLGLNHPKYNLLFRCLGPLVGLVLTLGFISIPISILLGIVH